MTNFEKVKEGLNIEEIMSGFTSGFCKAIHRVNKGSCPTGSCNKCRMWLKQEYKPQILDNLI